MVKYLSLSLLTLGICACSSGMISPEQYDPTKHAKIRIFAYEQTYGLIHADIDCSSNKLGRDIQVGSEMVNIFSSEKIKTIGMKQTKNTEQAGNGAELVYQEFIVEAGKPVNIEPYVVGVRTHRVGLSQIGFRNVCDKKDTEARAKKILNVILPSLKNAELTEEHQRSFIPEAGHSYEYLPAYQRCDGMKVLDISRDSNTPVSLSEKFICK